ncbi:uncharacterized protein (DUF2141 family) [Sphingomonas kyeonggiensis]|uniref:DUF2141 domain-containing protein n=1 Tax=Sphingomonas kyeonggiensis TaxID=1268553 RepID=UPI0027848CBF|nr:DUF2141 domain-containing protein [Sphingomonas kyeonggiensis]MDQ0248244.1 uncharacterized protein (DUF2141 family) [Sphingomonas kyeonggiensis]
MIRALTASTAAALAFAASPAAAQQDPVDGTCAIPGGARLYVNVTGLKDRIGRLKVELYPPNEEDFLRDDTSLKKEGKPFRRVWASVPQSGPVRICIRAPSAGTWAVLFTHDRDGKNKFNFWEDGAGFASNQKLGRSRPKVRQALVNVGAGGGQITIKAQYLRGLGGFGPLDD